jgi:ketosteroid isomerase-like protein
MRASLTTAALILLSVAGLGAGPADDLAKAKAEIAPLDKAMRDAANAHDSVKHVSYYANDPMLLFVINTRAIVGFDALLAQQKVWWLDGKSDAVYSPVGEPDYRLVAPGLVMETYFLTSHRTTDGKPRDTKFGVSALWQHRPEGWKIIYAHESTVDQ